MKTKKQKEEDELRNDKKLRELIETAHEISQSDDNGKSNNKRRKSRQ